MTILVTSTLLTACVYEPGGATRAHDLEKEAASCDPGGDTRVCADRWLEAYEQCFAEAGVSDNTSSADAVEAVARCWTGDAKRAFDACCASSPDASCANDGMDWPQPPGTGSCATDLFAAMDACERATGVQIGDGSVPMEMLHIDAYCWQQIAAAASDRCCAADPSRCDTDDIDPPSADLCEGPVRFEDTSCAARLLVTNNQCLAAAGISQCDWRPAAIAVQEACWQDGVDAKAACCAATPDWSCR